MFKDNPNHDCRMDWRTCHRHTCGSNARCTATDVGGPLHRETLPVRSTNPKKAQGMRKPPMHLVPAAGIVHEAMAFKDGAGKYGPFNWRNDPVDATTYVAACKRHLELWFNGQEFTSDTNVHNLGAARACLGILLDAMACGNLIDDRPPAQDLEGLMDMYTEEFGE